MKFVCYCFSLIHCWQIRPYTARLKITKDAELGTGKSELP